MTSTLQVPSPSGEFESLSNALEGQYTIDRELGRGGMGIVLLARDVRLDRQVALKVLPPALAQQQETRERFLREARMAAQLSHPHIVPVHRADDIGGFAFFAMGFVDGETLGDRVRDRGALAGDEVVRVLREVAWALADAHARGIVHRDIKPENILLERSSGRAIVTDFGIARADFNPALTQDGYVLGTVHYMSPEQSSGEPLDGRSDLYALGCVGFFALSGRLPFEGQSPQAILVAHATKEPPSLRSVAPHVPAALAAVIDRCLCKRPADRFASGEALAEALARALSDAELEARAEGTTAIISGDDAMAVWRRAAELQAEAASRLEARVRATQGSRQLTPGVSAPTGAAVGFDASEAAIPTDAYRLRDVEAAAAEAGISHRYVALALAEIKASPNAAQRMAVPAWKDRLATRLLGTTQRTLSVARIFRHPARVVLPALGRALQSAPYLLTLRDTLGGHPLDGGVLAFDVPAMLDGSYKWTYTRYGLNAKEVRVTLAPVPGDASRCEVSMQVDLRPGLGANIAVSSIFAGGGSVCAAVISGAIAKKAFAMVGMALLGPVLGSALVVGAGVLAIALPLFRWQLGKMESELAAALAAVDSVLRSRDIFGEAPPPPLPPQADGNASLLLMG